ncbi:MAG: Bax inhibitor-1 family protein [Mariniblastus sp.]|nr:Bax inhibitor-1 family protein [Mariniblastus sp.]
MSQNPYQSADFGFPQTAEFAAADARATFIRKTYMHLLGAILACIALDAAILTLFDAQLAPIVQWVSQSWHWLLFLGSIMAVSYVADSWARSNASRQMQYAGLALYVVAEAVMLVPLLYIARHFAGPDTIQSAGLVTAIVFSGLTFTVFLTGADFSFLKWALVAGGFVALAVIVVGCFSGFTLGLWFSVAMVVLAAGMILYSTSNVLHHYNTNQYVAASLALFASIALLFWYVLQIFMSQD